MRAGVSNYTVAKLLTGAALALAEGTVGSAKEFAAMEPDGNYQLTADITVTAPYGNDITGFIEKTL